MALWRRHQIRKLAFKPSSTASSGASGEAKSPTRIISSAYSVRVLEVYFRAMHHCQEQCFDVAGGVITFDKNKYGPLLK